VSRESYNRIFAEKKFLQPQLQKLITTINFVVVVVVIVLSAVIVFSHWEEFIA
jgi:hypothetical protein